MQELITVIINVYNREQLVKKCLESVLNQTYKNLEILIINDGSTDNTLKICESYKDKRIKIISTSNMGLAKSRNIGIENAIGDYLYFVDSDDFIEEDTIEYLYNLCKCFKVKLSTCMSLTIFNYNFKPKKQKEKIQLINSYDMLKKVITAKDSAGTTWNKLYKKELFNNIRFENRVTDDVTVTYKLVIKAEKIAYSNQKKYYYLKHSDAITIKEYEDYNRTIDLYNASIERYINIKKIYPYFLENNIGMIRNLIKVYLVENEAVNNFVKERELIKEFKKLFSFKIFIKNINFTLKIEILLFAISPKLCKKIVRKYIKQKYFK